MQPLEKIEQLIDSLCEKFAAIREENERLYKQIETFKGQLQEKDLEIIRLKKDQQRQMETLERELMRLKKERSEYEDKLSKLHQKLSASLGVSTEESKRNNEEKQG
ncbi:MAG TPA: hypothetical protein PLR17_01800 [Acetomicrobium flavidum]|uniref:Cell division protein ZapB n=2 Tax=Acetomicrobium TaxID=49894 RepID=I4BW83_ACEMN|nr:hypothetical protein [Acetomicrobium mobile]NLG95258.1 hypothetical protein [Acetomicrobium flavidum]AFM21540.1 hypothetical protein Anamo_0905 [Acetomicrobium mobile DSM 13181]SIN62645.1 hypothetical protein SAMN05444368_0214 [Acetomicrobium flavidum]HOJ81802.1 hypothetical protein [Acetomicrobium flavidum]HOM30787.1 hypothetical protein [Acetomicrobium flavidum]